MINFRYLEHAAQEAKDNNWLWEKYLRKIVTEQGTFMEEHEIDAFLESPIPTPHQKETFKQAIDTSTKYHQEILSLNKKAKTPLLDAFLKEIQLDTR